MGFLSKLKSNLTGSWADVSISAAPAQRGESVAVTLKVFVKAEPITVDRIYAKIRCIEKIEMNNVRSSSSSRDNENGLQSSGRVNESSNLMDEEFTITGRTDLEANSQHEFKCEFQIPRDMPPTIQGRYAKFEWEVFGALDMKGNDPDSKWREVRIS